MDNKQTINELLNDILGSIREASEEKTEDAEAYPNMEETSTKAPSLKGKLGILLNDVLDELILGDMEFEDGAELLATVKAVAIYESL